MGTIVTYGRATALVAKTGMSTEMGKIATSIQEIKPEKTLIQESINKRSRYIIILVLGIVGTLVAVGLVRRLDVLQTLLLLVVRQSLTYRKDYQP